MAIFLAIFVVIGLVAIILTLIPWCNQKLKKHIQKLQKDVFWNKIILSITIIYLQKGYYVTNSTKKILKERIPDVTEVVPQISTFSIMVLFALFISIFLYKMRNNLHTNESMQKYERIYYYISLKKNDKSLCYYPAFLTKRLVFCMIPLLIPRQFSYFQF